MMTLQNHKDISLNELKLMLDNDLLYSAEVLKNDNASYLVVFLKKDDSSYILVKDKHRDQPRSYKSIDRLISAMQELGYKRNFKLSLIEDCNQSKLEDFKFLIGNKINHVLEDIETHLKYGQDFNYDKDFKQIEKLVKELKGFVGEYYE